MKKLFITAMLTIGAIMYGQVGIGTPQPHPSAILDADSTNKGFLPPQLTSTERDSIQSPAPGLMIYNTDNQCLEYWNNTKWIGRCNKNSKKLLADNNPQ